MLPSTSQWGGQAAPLLIGISGRKKSGKSTLAKALIEAFGGPPAAERFAFADPLKRFCVDLLGLPAEQVYGTDEDKEALTRYRWRDLPQRAETERYVDGYGDEPLTVRQVMQCVGDTFRMFDPHIFITAALRAVTERRPQVAVIDDVRYRNEAAAIKAAAGVVVRLTRGRGGDSHPSEVDLDAYPGFDLVVPDLPAAETAAAVVAWLRANSGGAAGGAV